MKTYALDTLFPTIWGQDETHLQPSFAEKSKEEDTDEAIRAAIHEQDMGDPLKIRGKIRCFS